MSLHMNCQAAKGFNGYAMQHQTDSKYMYVLTHVCMGKLCSDGLSPSSEISFMLRVIWLAASLTPGSSERQPCIFFCGRRPLPFGGSHLRLPSGPAGIRTTTGSLSALARPTPYQRAAALHRSSQNSHPFSITSPVLVGGCIVMPRGTTSVLHVIMASGDQESPGIGVLLAVDWICSYWNIVGHILGHGFGCISLHHHIHSCIFFFLEYGRCRTVARSLHEHNHIQAMWTRGATSSLNQELQWRWKGSVSQPCACCAIRLEHHSISAQVFTSTHITWNCKEFYKGACLAPENCFQRIYQVGSFFPPNDRWNPWLDRRRKQRKICPYQLHHRQLWVAVIFLNFVANEPSK